MKAMIFAAGLGTRLRPLTDNCPKALIEVGGKPMLQIVMEQLKRYHFEEIIINVHYLANHIRDFLQQHDNFGMRVEISDESEEILETGGGLWKARHFFDDGQPFLVCNADILTDINLQDFYQYHLHHNAIATLAVRNRPSSRYLLFDDQDVLFGWEHVKEERVIIPRRIDPSIVLNTTEYPLHEFAFSGYHMLSPDVFQFQRREGKFSMVDWYLDLCGSHIVKAYHHDNDIWIDIGSEQELSRANEVIKEFGA